MKLFISCSSDTYITNKIVSDARANTANVGRAGTLDLFKLYDETNLTGSAEQIELSRILVKFDIESIKNRISSQINLNSQNFNARLKLYDVSTGNAKPTNYKILVVPLSKSFDEGFGRDIGSFSDISAANFLTSSIEDGSIQNWSVEGANSGSLMGDPTIDYYDRGNLRDGRGVQFLFAEQKIIQGSEDLNVDVTSIVSASLAGIVKNNGFRISFSGSAETDKRTRFVKRFASRHVSNPNLRPKIEISFEDFISDHHSDFIFDHTGSLYLENKVRGKRKNILSGSALKELTGAGCLDLKLVAGKFSFITRASQATQGSDNAGVAGLYRADFALDSFEKSLFDKNTTIAEKIARDGEIKFRTFWQDVTGAHAYSTGSLVIRRPDTVSGLMLKNIDVFTTNLNLEFDSSDTYRVRVFALDTNHNFLRSSKRSISRKSIILDGCYYRIVDSNTGLALFDFGVDDNSTKLSSDSSGMFFDFNFSVATIGRSYHFEFLIIDGFDRKIISDKKSRFSVR